MQIDSCSTSSEISFHGLPSKSKSKRPSIRKQIASSLSSQYCFYKTVICREIFSKNVFASIFLNFQKIFAAHQKNVLKIFRKFTKKHSWRSLVLEKLQAFTEAATEGVPKKSVLKKFQLFGSSHRRCSMKKWVLENFAKFTGKHLCLAKFSKTPFQLFRSTHRRCSMKKGVLENFRKFTGKHLWFAKFSKTPFLQNTSGRLLLT